MPFVQQHDRDQIEMTTLRSMIDPDSIVHAIDLLVDNLDLQELGFDRTRSANDGRPAYDASSLLKLYIYGNMTGVRSSRKLEKACRINIEAMYLMHGMKPDHRTIANFRKRNPDALKKVFKELDRRTFREQSAGFCSVDGSKFGAHCARKNNFQKDGMASKLERLGEKIEQYMKVLEQIDAEEDTAEEANLTRMALEEKLQKARERLAKYEKLRDLMEAEGLSQISTTDPDAKLMKTKDGYQVSHNVQTAVDSNTHLIRDFSVTDAPTDHGQLEPTLHDLRAQNPDQMLETVADKGYESEQDLVSCLENGIIPNVIPTHGKEAFDLEMTYEESDVTDEMRRSTLPEDISACLHAGVVPEALKGAIENIEVIDTYRSEDKPAAEGGSLKSPYLSAEEAKERAAQGYFVRDPESNTVTCPGGQTLHQKCIRKNGDTVYANRRACADCPSREKCFGGKQTHKEAAFSKDTLEKPNRRWKRAENDGFAPEKPKKRGPMKRIKVVHLRLRPDQEKMNRRNELSEHPFGTAKRLMGDGRCLLRGKVKVTGELALVFLAYNLKRVLNMIGIEGFKRVMA